MRRISFQFLMTVCAFTFFLIADFQISHAEATKTVGGYPETEALLLGERMYREGLLPSGNEMKAIVQGDIEMVGTMTTCANCHLRSGLGALEGGVFSPPTNGVRLYGPLRDLQDIPGSSMKRSMFTTPRPPYSRETLAAALRFGKSSNGSALSESMPRYELSDSDMAILIHYLENLTSQMSPGITDEEIRFATIVTETVSTEDRESLLLPLTTYIRNEWNGRLSNLETRPGVSFSPSALGPGSKRYRKLTLDVWELKGSAESWPRQLEDFYRRKPVFAILGGVVPGKWDPIHSFSEENRIPCILPITDLPVVSHKDWYTLYYSKGFYQEGETAAKYLTRVFTLPPEKRVVQVYRESDAGLSLSGGFRETWKEFGSSRLIDRPVLKDEKIDELFWIKLSSSYPDAVVLTWLEAADLKGVQVLATSKGRPSTVIASAGLLRNDFSPLPDQIREQLLLTYPTRLPGSDSYSRSLFTGWMKFNKIQVPNLSIGSKAFTITRLLSRIFLDMEGNLYRDYFLDIFDDNRDEASTSLEYPKLSFGPGQRYAVKGCYMISLSAGPTPAVIPQSDWVVY